MSRRPWRVARSQSAARGYQRTAWWPARLLVIGFVLLLRTIGRGVGVAVLSAKLTAPEMQRRIDEQAAEIARLTKEIDGRET